MPPIQTANGVYHGWAYEEDNWHTGMEANLLLLDALISALADETTARQAGDAAEATARAAAIVAEADARALADGVLQANLDAVEQAAIDADAALDARLGAVETEQLAHAGTLADLADADTALDTRLDAAEADVADHETRIVALEGASGGSAAAVGDVRYATASPGADWLLCDGTTYAKATYPALGAVVGNVAELPMKTTAIAGATAAGTLMAYGNGTWVCLSTSGQVWTSPTGIDSWTARTAIAGTIASVTYANGLFVAVGTSNSWWSTDGITWTVRALPGAYTLRGVAYGNGMWIAVATTSGNVLTNPDPSTTAWTARAHGGGAVTFNAVAYGNGRWVIAGSPTYALVSLDNGVTWAIPTNQRQFRHYYAQDDGGGGVMYGYTTESINGLVWTGEHFVAVNQKAAFFTSKDGYLWAEQRPFQRDPASGGNSAWCLRYADGLLVANGNYYHDAGVGHGALFVSEDHGRTWLAYQNLSSYTFNNVTQQLAIGGGRVVAPTTSSGNMIYFDVYSYDTATQFRTPRLDSAMPNGVRPYIKAA